jgi:hypothetical protein
MPSPTPLPDDLTAGPFRPRDLRDKGIGVDVLRGRRVQRASHGVYLLDGTHPTLVDRCRAVGLVVPGDVTFSHVTAARLLGAPSWGSDARVHLTRPPGASALRRAGVVQHRSWLLPEERLRVAGLTVTSPGRTLLDLAGDMRLDRLVAVGDHWLRRSGVETSLLDAIGHDADGRRGVRRFRQAVPLMDPRAESPQESLVRVWCMLAGLPFLEPQGKVWDGGELVATVDLLDEEHRIAVEYEGAHHREREQFAYDIQRRTRLRRRGYRVVQVEASMMSSPRGVVLFIVGDLRQRGWTGEPRVDELNRVLWPSRRRKARKR